MTIRRSTDQWIRLLRDHGGEPPMAGARLGAGACDAPLVASVLSALASDSDAAPPAAVAVPDPLPRASEARLWWAIHQPSPTTESLPDTGGIGPLLPVDDYRAIEVWTECELASLHALRNLAGRPDVDPHLRSALATRLDRAVTWHLDHTQPDNATNRPWAIHVFAERSDPEAQLYAEGLLHACQVGSTQLEPLSRAILLDAALQLERRPLGIPGALR